MNIRGHARLLGMTLTLTLMLMSTLAVSHSVAALGAQTQLVDGVSIAVNMTSISVTEGDFFTFSTNISNSGGEITPSLIAHLNVASLVEGVYVDPEDWSSQRTIFMNPIEPGSSVSLTWRIHALFAGNIAVYVAVLPLNSTMTPVISDQVVVHVEKWTVLGLSDVMPVIILVPAILGAALLGQVGRIVLLGRRHDS